MAGASVEPGMQDIPVAFAEEVKALGPQVQKIAQEENVPASTIFTLWLKESGGRRRNPANGEGLCGFYSRVKGGRGYFTPGRSTMQKFCVSCANVQRNFMSTIGLELPLHTRHQILMS